MPLALLASLLLAPITLDYDVQLNGTKAGEAKLVQEIRNDGTKSTVLDVKFEAPDGRRIETHTEGVYDVEGKPLRRSQRTQLSNPWTVRLVTATFMEGSANVVVFENEGRVVKNIPLVRTAPTNDPVEQWFPASIPDPGTAVKSYVLNLETLVWDLVTTTYRGPEEITIGGKKQPAYKVDSEQGTVFLDGDGLPWIVDAPPLKLVRRTESRP
ncbi:MAG: hypothetical protein M9921_06025 [Fimbriimonadaceae bacterium]|nr:hypothetical protein [Fimbriimonadaceae bacterium]